MLTVGIIYVSCLFVCVQKTGREWLCVLILVRSSVDKSVFLSFPLMFARVCVCVCVCHIMGLGSGISVSHNWDHFDNGKGIYVTTGDLLSSRALVIPQQEPSMTPTHTPGDPAHTHTPHNTHT